MGIGMAYECPERIITVLQDYLPAEIVLFKNEVTTPTAVEDIPTGNYHSWDIKFIPQFPACSIRTVSSIPIEVRPDTFGQRIDAKHRFDVMFHVRTGDIASSEGETDPAYLLRHLTVYIACAARVLCVMYESLQTVADPTRWCEIVEWSDVATYGPEEEQEDGAIVRTATLPITVRRREAR